MLSRELLSYIGENVDREYLRKVAELSINPNTSNEVNDFKIVYTPLHGTGLMPIERALTILIDKLGEEHPSTKIVRDNIKQAKKKLFYNE